MIYNEILKGKNIYLRMLELEDCRQYYVDWMNDKEVNQYLESRWTEQTPARIQDFVKSIRESTHSYMFAIIFQNRHVGNIKLGPIHSIYKYADIGYLIGDRTVWGLGIATEAISLITRFGFEVLKLNRLQAGCFEQNIGSQRALQKNNYTLECINRQKAFLNYGDTYSDIYQYAILCDEWNKMKEA